MTFPYFWHVEHGQVWTKDLTYEGAKSFSRGTVEEVFADLDGLAKNPPSEFAWRMPKPSARLCANLANKAGAVAQKREGVENDKERCWHDIAETELFEEPLARWSRAAREQNRNTTVVQRISQCGVELHTRYWRALSFNAVLHFQFGPGLAVATNGVDVLLWASPNINTDWFLAHRSNVIGPVSGTEYDLGEWDYEGNKPAARCARTRDGITMKEIRATLLAEL